MDTGAAANVRKDPHTLMLSADTWRGLGHKAIDLGVDRSELAERWLRERLDRFEPRIAATEGTPPPGQGRGEESA